MKKIFYAAHLAVLTTITACGHSGNDDSIGSSAEPIAINITPDSDIEITAGNIQNIKAVAITKEGPVDSIHWAVTPKDGQAPMNPPTVVDSKCSFLNRTGGTVNNGITESGQATCNTVLTVPNSLSSGVWKVEAKAIGPQSVVAIKSFNLKVNSAPLISSGFKLVLPEKPIKFDPNSIASFMVNATVNNGIAIKDVKYNWELISEIRREGVSPTNPQLIGADTDTVSFLTSIDTTYYLRVTATANINGQNETVSAAVVAYTTTTPVTNPPVTNPPVTNPPVTNPPVTNPPVTNPPVTNPPVTNPPVTNPPVTNPPVTNPPLIDLSVSAGLPQIANLGSIITLNATTNLPGALFQWTQKSGPIIALSATVGTQTTFIALLPGVYTFEVMATVDGVSKIATTTVTVNDFNLLLNVPPIVTVGAQVDLSSTMIGEQVPLTYEWFTISSPINLSISNANSPNASFLAVAAGIYQIGLRATVGTGANAVTKEYSTLVVVNPFNIVLDNLINVQVGSDPVALAASIDIDTDKAVYEWVQISGNPLQLLNADTAQVSFLPTQENQEYEFMLTVTVGDVVKTVKTKVLSLLK